VTVTFCGHRNIAGEVDIADFLKEKLQALITDGADKFLLGGYGAFDQLAAHVLKELKTAFPTIKITLVIPYLDRDFNHELYDGSVYLPLEDVPKRFAISKRNEWMVDQSDVVVSYVKYDWGGAYTTLEYAKRKRKKIVSAVP